jgi:glycosyltransferase involved in cell wall biosynthesis
MKSENIKFSIITVCYQSVDFAQKCIENVISQSVTDQIEHVIIDGDSTDGTKEIVATYAERYPHIRFISEPDKGQSDAMNKGIYLAKGEYIGFLNVDDTYTEGALQEVIKFIQNKRISFLCGNLNVFDDSNNLIYVSKPNKNNVLGVYFNHIYPINPSCYFYLRSIHNKIGLYNVDDDFSMDLDFFLRYINKYKRYTYINKTLGNFYVCKETKTYIDKTNNLMFDRKKQLFHKYWRSKNIIIRFFLILKFNIMRLIRIL